jgi:hypothetical protein
MTRCESIMRCIIAVWLCTCAGCSQRDYLTRRAADLGDCFEVGIGIAHPPPDPVEEGEEWMAVGWLAPYAGVRATDFAVVSLGSSINTCIGWHWRYPPATIVHSMQYGLPLLLTYEYSQSFETAEHVVVRTWGPCVTRREYFHEPGPRGKVAQRMWTGVSATFLASVRAGFNPAEFADFLVGWFGWDMLKDDDWQPQPSEE